MKWRAKERAEQVGDRAGFQLGGPYDFIMMFDVIEHIKDWEPLLKDLLSRLREKGVLVTNFFLNQDYENPEHVNMDKYAVRKFLVMNDMIPSSNYLWRKEMMP